MPGLGWRGLGEIWRKFVHNYSSPKKEDRSFSAFYPLQEMPSDPNILRVPANSPFCFKRPHMTPTCSCLRTLGGTPNRDP